MDSLTILSNIEILNSLFYIYIFDHNSNILFVIPIIYDFQIL